MLPMAVRAVVVLALAFLAACGRPTGVPQPSPSDAQKLPFDREPGASGVSPSKSLVPVTTRLAEGTSIAIRLKNTVSSASAQSGDSFEGTLDEPVVVDGQPLIARGSAVTGRVLDVRPSVGRSPGYLRIALIKVEVGGKAIPIDTSSVFAKGGSHEGRAASGVGAIPNSKDIVFTPDRRLTFRLVQDAELP